MFVTVKFCFSQAGLIFANDTLNFFGLIDSNIGDGVIYLFIIIFEKIENHIFKIELKSNSQKQ